MSKDYDSGLFNKSRNRLPSEPSRLSHIFGVRPGHIKDTPKNRSTLEEVANDESNYIGTDKWGNKWYVKECENGAQYWVEVDSSGTIWDGGYNRSPILWNPLTGLKKSSAPGGTK